MLDGSKNASELQSYLARVRQGDTTALNDLIALVSKRLEVLTHRMLKDYPRVHRWAQTDDVLQNALVRLCRALERVEPANVREFYALATTQIRRELIDLARHFAGPENAAAHHESWNAEPGQERQAPEHSDITYDPAILLDWSEFHRQVADLPAEEQEVFGLIFYQGFTQENAADILGVAVRTVQRRWQGAMLNLHRARNGEPPGA